jgi:hypothetical protein
MSRLSGVDFVAILNCLPPSNGKEIGSGIPRSVRRRLRRKALKLHDFETSDVKRTDIYLGGFNAS